MSLRFKISLWSALISAIILAGFGVACWYGVYGQRLAAVDREIRTLAARHPGWLANRPNHERLTSMLEFTFGEQRKEQVILLIRDPSGTELYRSPHWPVGLDLSKLPLTLKDEPVAARSGASPEAAVPALGDVPRTRGGGGFGPGRGYGWGASGALSFTKVPVFLTVAASRHQWRLGVLGNEQTTLLMGISLEEVQGELNRLRNAFLSTLPIALLLVAGGGWVIGGRALRPLRAIADTAERVTARGLHERIPGRPSDKEVSRLIRVLNGMMDRLEASFHQATRFTADASHELKTPLSIMQAELESALHVAAVGSQEQQAFSSLLEETQRLKQITRNLLLLAQADSGQLKLSTEEVQVTELLESATEDARILGENLELTFEVLIQPNLRVGGDPQLLGIAVYNLLRNAVKYNQPHGCILVQAQREGGVIDILVGNTGPGIAEPDQAHLFERFFRGR